MTNCIKERKLVLWELLTRETTKAILELSSDCAAEERGSGVCPQI
jgi:hypothetical protein